MTDAASENLKIEGMIATSLQYNHEPVHLEKLDASNLNALSEVKNSVNQRQTLETKSPSLKSFFFRGKNTTVGVKKHIFLYQKCRFAKLGKAAVSIAQVYPVLKMLLDEKTSINQIVEAYKIYLSSELFFTELEALAFFNHNITFPFLNMVERSSQADLLKILSQLQKNLMQKKTDTLKKYIATSELGQHIVNLTCENAADGILM